MNSAAKIDFQEQMMSILKVELSGHVGDLTFTVCSVFNSVILISLTMMQNI